MSCSIFVCLCTLVKNCRLPLRSERALGLGWTLPFHEIVYVKYSCETQSQIFPILLGPEAVAELERSNFTRYNVVRGVISIHANMCCPPVSFRLFPSRTICFSRFVVDILHFSFFSKTKSSNCCAVRQD